MTGPNFPQGPTDGDNDGPDSLINYEQLLQNALRGLMREALRDVAAVGAFPGEHHFYIGFWTTAADVQMSDRLRAQYPEQMVIVLQHQFDGLEVTDEHFTVRLHFGGIPEPMLIPFDAVFRFEDPSVNFALQFGSADLADIIDVDGIEDESDLEAELADDAVSEDGAEKPTGTAEVVSLDAFRKGR